MTTDRNHRLQVIIAFAVVYVFWGSTYLAIGIADDEHLPPAVMCALRFLIAGPLMLAREGREAQAQLDTYKARLEADPKDHQARYDLASALNAMGEREQAAEALLEIVRRDRKWNEEAARKQLVKLFEAMGPTDPLTVGGRKRLSSLLFA